MKSRPIIFSDPMIKALLNGSKTMTRRVVKPQLEWLDKKPFFGAWGYYRGKQYLHVGGDDHPDGWERIKAGCPYGQPGDWLWVREAWGIFKPWESGKVTALVKGRMPDEPDDPNEPDWMVDYRERNELEMPKKGPWRSPIHMPRWASRLTLRLTDVRVERVQEISEEDAKAEGAHVVRFPNLDNAHSDLDRFRALWNSINSPRGYGWDTNPWVWVLEFKVFRGNIDGTLQEQAA